MRTLEEIKKYLTRKGHSFDYDGCDRAQIEYMLTQLWNDENVVDAMFVWEENDAANVLFFFTNKYRMLVSKWMKKIELKHVDLNKCRILEYENTSLFGKPKPAVSGRLIVDDKQLIGRARLTELQAVYKVLSKQIKDCAAAEQAAREAEKTIAPVAQTASSNNIAEIRKLYEDGIITKEEMIDLIKSIGSK